MISFRTPEQNRLKLASIFLEPRYDEDTAIYSLKDYDTIYKGKVYPSLYRLYIEMSDVTEYVFANKYFESYQHWMQVCEADTFKDTIERWRKELELKIKSKALQEIIEQASSTDPRKRLEASKYLYEKVYVEGSKGRGRPSKAEVRKEAQKQAEELKLVQAHLDLMQTSGTVN